MKNDNFVLALRKRLFCDAKPTLLPCKTAVLTTQNNSFCKMLIISWLSNNYTPEMHFYRCTKLKT